MVPWDPKDSMEWTAVRDPLALKGPPVDQGCRVSKEEKEGQERRGRVAEPVLTALPEEGEKRALPDLEDFQD